MRSEGIVDIGQRPGPAGEIAQADARPQNAGDIGKSRIEEGGARDRPALACDLRRGVKTLIHHFVCLAVDGDEGVADREQGRDDQRWALGDIDPKPARADRDDTNVILADNTFSQVLPNSSEFGPEGARGAKLRLTDWGGAEASALVHWHRPDNLIRARVAFVWRDGFDPDSAFVRQNAEVGLTALAQAFGNRQQAAAGVEEGAAKIHFPETAVDVARKAMAEIRIGIRLVALPHSLDEVVQFPLDWMVSSPEVDEATIKVWSIEVENAGHDRLS